MATTYTLIESSTVGSGGTSSVTFSNIPQTYTDLKVVYSARGNESASSYNTKVTFAGIGGTAYSSKLLYGDGSSANSYSFSSNAYLEHQYHDSASATSNTFGNTEMYIPNYTSSNAKSVNVDSVTENNATSVSMGLSAGLFNNSTPITSITLFPYSGYSFNQYSTFYLYGIKNS